MSKGTELKLSKMLSVDCVVDLISSKKENVIKELVQVISTCKSISNRLDFYKAVFDREKLASTGIGSGVAVPHAKSACVSDFVIALGRKPEGINFESVDGEPVSVVMLIGAPENRTDDLLRLLSKILLIFKNSKFRKKVNEARSKADLINAFKDK